MAATFSDRAPAAVLSHERLRQALAVRDWLLGEAREIRDPNVILEGLSLKLRDAGVPVDRSISAIELRHAERAANARIWEWGGGAREHVFEHARGSESTGKRPLAEAPPQSVGLLPARGAFRRAASVEARAAARS